MLWEYTEYKKSDKFAWFFFPNTTAPDGVFAPFLSISSTAVVVTWQPPSQPNGQLLGYNLYRSTDGEQAVLLKSVNSSVFHFVDSSFAPYTSYMYYIEAENSAGKTAGPSSTVVSPEAGQLPCVLQTWTITHAEQL